MDEQVNKTFEKRVRRRGVTKRLIIELITKHREGVRWTKLLEETKLSKPGLLMHLNELKKEGIIISRRKGKKSFYKLTEHALADFETKVQLFSMSSLSMINKIIVGDSDKRLEKISVKQLVNDLSRYVMGLTMFSILKSIEKNKGWYEAPVFYLQQPGGLRALIERKIASSNMNIKTMYENVKKEYTKEFKQFELIYDNPREPKFLETGKPMWRWDLVSR